MKLDFQTTVGELMAHHPSVIRVFIQRNLRCVGCPGEAFHSLEEAARFHGCPLGPLLEALQQVIETQENP